MSFGKLGALGGGFGHQGGLGGASSPSIGPYPPIGPLPAATELLMASRMLGLGASSSNATDTDSNSHLGFYNESGATVTKLRIYNQNWKATPSGSNETDGDNSITITATVEYPAGTRNIVQWSASSSAAIAANALALESDELTLSTPIPPGAVFWVNTYVSCTAGGKWPTGYAQSSFLTSPFLDAVAAGTGTSDLTQVGGVVNNAAKSGYGPTAIKATAFTGTLLRFGLVGLGDSVIAGATDAFQAAATSHGNIGALGKAATGRVPYLNLGITGSAIQQNTGANFTKRLDLLSKLGPLIVVCNWGSNDIVGGRSAAQVDTDMSAVGTPIRALSGIKKFIVPTIIPRNTSRVSVSSLTSVGTLATAFVPAGTANLRNGERVTITGATPSAYNVTANINVIDANTITYTFAGGTSPATGTILVSDLWQSPDYQTHTVTGFTPVGASVRDARNLAIRSGPLSYADGFFEWSRDIIEVGDTAVWKSGLSGIIQSGSPPATHIETTYNGTVTAGINTTTFNSNLTPAATSQFFGGYVYFLTGALAGQFKTVSSNTAGGQFVMTSGFTGTPGTGDTFILLPINMQATSDGTHPSAANTAGTFLGGVFLLRDACIAQINAWLALGLLLLIISVTTVDPPPSVTAAPQQVYSLNDDFLRGMLG